MGRCAAGLACGGTGGFAYEGPVMIRIIWISSPFPRRSGIARYNAESDSDGAMACFCGCPKHIRHENGFRLACVECGHGPQNHEDQFRESARGNESASQKRDADFG